jgi:hypothetical protein
MILSLVPTARRRTVVRRVSRAARDTEAASPTKLSLPDDTRRHPPAVKMIVRLDLPIYA